MTKYQTDIDIFLRFKSQNKKPYLKCDFNQYLYIKKIMWPKIIFKSMYGIIIVKRVGGNYVIT